MCRKGNPSRAAAVLFTLLVSGTAGTGKTSIAAQFAEAACKRGERVLFFTFEESPGQLMRNMLSIGIKLKPWVKKGLLQFHATRPTLYGLETHLATSIKWINSFEPSVAIFDPISAFVTGDNQTDVRTMLVRIVDYLKFNRAFERECPGFETDIHGLVHERGPDGGMEYFADCVAE